MRLKLIIFPMAVLVAICISIFWIKPEVMEILVKRVELKNAQERLQLTNNKKDNVSNLIAQIDTVKTDLDYVKSYLPFNPEEDKIINSLNALAGNANVVLMDISFSAAAGKATAVKAAAEEKTRNSLEIVNLPITVKVLGNYESIKSFLVRLAAIEKFSKIKSFSITPVPTNPEEVSAAILAEAKPENLLVEIALDFGSAVELADASVSAIDTNTGFNFAIIPKLKSTVNGSISRLDLGTRGKSNPFAK